jgi:SAM-dependent methyltransferase
MQTTCPCCDGELTSRPVLVGKDRLHGLPGEFPVVACASCGTGVTLPRLSSERLGEFYPETYGPYDAIDRGVLRRISQAIQARQGQRALRTAPLRALRAVAPGRVLDVGCGRGDLGAFLISRGWRVTGIEPSPAAIAAAAARGIDARRGTLADIALERSAYDAAIFHHSLEHVADPATNLRRVAQSLAPGGLVLVSVPNFACWQPRSFRDRWYHLDLPRHRVHFTPVGLERVLAAAGLEPLSTSTSTSSVGFPATLQYAVFGRCLFPEGLPLRVAAGLCVLLKPIAALVDRVRGGGDVLHAVARKPLSAA